jgi:hypothetical protein
VLADFGVWLLGDGRRLELAEQLAGDGATADELETVCGYVEAQAGHDPKATGQRLAMILRPGVWRRTLTTAEKHQARKTARGNDHGETRRMECHRQVVASRDESYVAMRAYALLHYDQKAAREVAEVLEVSVAKLPALVRAGAEMYGADPEKAVDRLLMKAAAR